MLRRKILEDLLQWKRHDNRLCLLVKGARQVGKTYIIRKFAEENYKNFIELNFFENEGYRAIFADIFTKLGKKLYYYEKNSTLEIDFFIRRNKTTTAVEVKSADNT